MNRVGFAILALVNIANALNECGTCEQFVKSAPKSIAECNAACFLSLWNWKDSCNNLCADISDGYGVLSACEDAGLCSYERNLTAAGNVSSAFSAVHCSARGGCDCDCSWAKPATCGHDDGSCCHACCCVEPPPGPGPAPGPSASYCPSANDFFADYGSPQIYDGGWSVHGGARVQSKASFNFAGGFMEFDMDLSGAHGNVNNNFYLTYPRDGRTYCDSGGSCGGNCCAEMDITENNGNCFQATTWHTNRDGSDHDGKAQTGGINAHVHIKATWSADGSQLTVDVNGNQHSGEGFADVMASPGAIIYSSQWTGWVPGSCGGDGNLGASSFSVSNLKIQGKIVQGPEPAKCNEPALGPAAVVVV